MIDRRSFAQKIRDARPPNVPTVFRIGVGHRFYLPEGVLGRSLPATRIGGPVPSNADGLSLTVVYEKPCGSDTEDRCTD